MPPSAGRASSRRLLCRDLEPSLSRLAGREEGEPSLGAVVRAAEHRAVRRLDAQRCLRGVDPLPHARQVRADLDLDPAAADARTSTSLRRAPRRVPARRPAAARRRVVRLGVLVAWHDGARVALDAPRPVAEVDVVEQRRLERDVRDVRRDVDEPQARRRRSSIVRSTRRPRGSSISATAVDVARRARSTCRAGRRPPRRAPTLSSPHVVTRPPPHDAVQSPFHGTSPRPDSHAICCPPTHASATSSPRSGRSRTFTAGAAARRAGRCRRAR